MRNLTLLILVLIVSVFSFRGNRRAGEIENSLKAAVSPDSLLELARRIPVKMRSETAPREITKDPMGPFPCVHVKDVLGRHRPVIFHINEGVVYNPTMAGRYSPLFPIERFRINEYTDFRIEDFLDDSWDELIGYVGLYIFDDTDQRRHIHDSLNLETDASRRIPKK